MIMDIKKFREEVLKRASEITETGIERLVRFQEIEVEVCKEMQHDY